MTSALILAFLKDHWKKIGAAALIGVAVIGATTFYSSWRMRGAKVERLTVQLETALFQNQKDRAACQEIAAVLAEVNAHNAQLTVESDAQRAAFIEADTISSKEIEYNRSEAEIASAKAVEAIERAATCEEKVKELSRVMSEFRP